MRTRPVTTARTPRAVEPNRARPAQAATTPHSVAWQPATTENPVAQARSSLERLWAKGASPSAKRVLDVVGTLTAPWNKTMATEFAQPAGVREGYTLGRHTGMVLQQFRRYFSDEKPPGLERHEFELLLALHDGGKPEAIRQGGKEGQHRFTTALLEHVKPSLPVSDAAFARMKALSAGDPMGEALRGMVTLPEAAKRIKALARQAQLPPSDFFRLLTVFYQSDASSYTRDAGGLASLELPGRVFEPKADGVALQFDPEARRLTFQSNPDAVFRQLERAVQR